jgi:phospholipid-translocating ATPase
MRKIVFASGKDHVSWQYPSNKLSNTKYTWYSFVPVVLFNQFKYFFNLFFLLVALSQLIDRLRVGFLISYLGPLIFVLFITMAKEIYDDYKRAKRDTSLNNVLYDRMDINSGRVLPTPARSLRVGDIIKINSGERVPADLILIASSEKGEGSIFIRTDQLDGETDWKVRLPVA